MTNLFMKAERRSQDGETATYEFWPDYFTAEERSGMFAVTTDVWQPKLLQPSNAASNGVKLPDEAALAALTGKLRRHFESTGKIAERVSYQG